MYRKGRPECSLCLELKAENNRKPDCQKCEFTELEPENYLACGLVEKYSGFFISGDGSIRADGIRFAFELDQIPLEQRPELARNITIYLSTALRAQRGS